MAKEEKGELVDQSILLGAVLAVSLLIFQSYLSQPVKPLDWFQIESLICFAIAFPGLALWFLVYHLTSKGKHLTFETNKKLSLPLLSSFAFIFIVLFSSIAAITGIGLSFWRLSPIAGGVFLLMSAFCLVEFFLVG